MDDNVELFTEKCKAIYKLTKDKTDILITVIDNLDKVCLSCDDEALIKKCKQAYNILLDHDELKASFLEIVKMKKKMSDFITIVSDGNLAVIMKKNSLN
jgi:hypothetical protein